MRWPWQAKQAKARTPDQATGDAGERAAERFLRKRGHRILARNVAYRQGEVDLVAMEKATRTLCFIEVRSRTSEEGEEPTIRPEETVGRTKRRRIISAAKMFLAERRAFERPVRFDVIAVEFRGDGRRRPEIRHYPGAFDATGR
jgi:putative endonuclease